MLKYKDNDELGVEVGSNLALKGRGQVKLVLARKQSGACKVWKSFWPIPAFNSAACLSTRLPFNKKIISIFFLLLL